MATRLSPKTDAVITVKLSNDDDGSVVNTATVTAAIFAPNARSIATNQTVSSTGSGGLYNLLWNKLWTEYNSKVVLGEYLVVVTGVNAGITRTEHFRIPIAWGDDT